VPITHDLVAPALALNNAHTVELGSLEADRFGSLLGQAFFAAAIGRVDAFVLALLEGAAYDSPNFLWFRQRYPRFVYVDRVVVSAESRGRGYARRMYGALFEKAKQAGHTMVACEVNIVPPNPVSDAFHASLDFVEVGRASVYGGTKTVRYLTCNL